MSRLQADAFTRGIEGRRDVAALPPVSGGAEPVDRIVGVAIPVARDQVRDVVAQGLLVPKRADEAAEVPIGLAPIEAELLLDRSVDGVGRDPVHPFVVPDAFHEIRPAIACVETGELVQQALEHQGAQRARQVARRGEQNLPRQSRLDEAGDVGGIAGALLDLRHPMQVEFEQATGPRSPGEPVIPAELRRK